MAEPRKCSMLPGISRMRNMMNGTITVDSELGKGTEFVVMTEKS